MNTPLAPSDVITKAIEEAPQGTTVVLTKTPARIRLEASLYFGIAALYAIDKLLSSDVELSARSIAGACVAGLIAGGIALKSYLSTSKSS